MKKSRILYICLIGFIILCGLLSRRVSMIPLFTGDLLYALMMYFIIRFLWLHSSIRFVAFISLLICWLIEFGQLSQAGWLVSIRQNLLGRLILGQGFLWSDLIAYLAGVISGILIDRLIHLKANGIN
ncbi:Protein of unknown function [Pseudarcicella hirudinis]|uniref:DUF2809 domain-containing protein n=1 Tax=Pseudarcicella hirudinis TaxID=1079859 RepID=A0A1I5YMD7_9BACT|nr:DUF2809 domain-containing protein [Pseudarcicella hirudinis]SFQ45366.1 Protein of unknown function [Pseudarcicella hirudinis]